MQPTEIISDAGNATAGTPYNGPYTGPDQFLSSGLTYLDIDRNVVLTDAIAQLQNGGAPTQLHAYLLSLDDVQHVVAVLYSSQILPSTSVQARVVPHILLPAGHKLFIRGVQMSEASTAAAEATQLILSFAEV